MNYKKLVVTACVFSLSLFVFFNSDLKAQSNNTSTAVEEEEYFPPTFENFSKAYWRFKKFRPDDKTAIDNYMMINECDLYTEYYHNEFEWAGIQRATKDFLAENTDKFPQSFEFIQGVSLGEFDFEQSGFNIAKEYKLESVKRFEIPSGAFGKHVCGYRGPIDGYPRVIALELTRPLTFAFFKMDEALAREILAEKMDEFEKLSPDRKTRKRYLEARQVYLRVKVKMFAYKPEDFQRREGHYVAKMLGILEEIEVFSDREMTQVMYRQDLRRKKRAKKKRL